jgi:hypothetical protein
MASVWRGCVECAECAECAEWPSVGRGFAELLRCVMDAMQLDRHSL